MTRQVFISHRHADREIANVIKECLLDWGLPQESIFQSSDAKHGPQIGDPLEKALKEALHKANLVLLTYTFSDRDWSYCMWECGVAIDPIKEDTRLIVFQCTDDEPDPFRASTRVKITKNDIYAFTTQFYTQADFFPGQKAFAKNTGETTLKAKSKRLYEGLREAVPTGRLEQRSRWDHLTLQLDTEFVEQVKEIKAERNRKRGVDIIQKNLVVIDGFGQACRHFGFDVLEVNERFYVYVERWSQRMAGKNAPDKWINELCTEIWRAIRNMSAEPTWEYLRSAVRGTDWWFYPILNHATILPDNKMKFALYLYRAPTPPEEPVGRKSGGSTAQ